LIALKVPPCFSIREIARFLILPVWIAAACMALSAQTERTITILLLDSQTGQPIVPVAGNSGINVTVNESGANPQLKAHPVKDGLWELKVTQDVEKVQFDNPAGPGGWVYVYCDSSKLHPQTWPSYSAAEIFNSGVEAPNRCNKRFAQAKPGEIILFVRRPNWMEKMPM
jgi:hypothetical protein